ncbi:MAG: helix-turn-helix transcriptional regulator [Bacilli bacterium]|nr:helix-turn-helix transcriptional regulator [Bacilli bacterium]
MNFGENLQNIRKRENLSQEELADKLNVSRQSVSKWESGISYPEIEKIIMICEIFQCSMDELVKGEIKTSVLEGKREYDSFLTKFSKGMAFGVFLILFGVTLLLMIMSCAPNKEALEQYIMIGAIVLLIFVVIAVPIFIILGMRMNEIQKKYKDFSNFYSEKEKEIYNHKFSILIATTVSIILIGVIVLLSLYGFQICDEESLFPVALFMIFITFSVPFIVNAGIQKSKYEMTSYKECHKVEKNDEIIGKISAVIMISATILYFILGFVFHLWKLNWLVFPVGGMLCGIVSVIFSKEV